MPWRSKLAVALPLSLVAASAFGFPEGAASPSADELRKRLADRVFGVTLANGATWRLEFKGSGYVFVDTSSGFRGNGPWRTEDGKLCSKLQGNQEVCNEARVHDDVLHLRRVDGEIIRYIPK